jgi:hypothetical protein
MTMAAAPPNSGKTDRLFYLGMSITAAVVVFWGFASSYFLKSFYGTPLLTPLVHAHGLAFTAWIALFFTQTVLIAGGERNQHRKLGTAGACLATVMVVLGVAAAVGAIRSNHTPPGIDPRSFLVLPFFDIAVFAILVGAGIAFRGQPETHKRLMFLATVAMLDAPIARLPGIFALGPLVSFALQDMFLAAGIGYDLALCRRVGRAYVWGGLLFLLSQPLRLYISGTPWWLAFGDWIKG